VNTGFISLFTVHTSRFSVHTFTVHSDGFAFMVEAHVLRHAHETSLKGGADGLNLLPSRTQVSENRH
jgi:hypothetical protein